MKQGPRIYNLFPLLAGSVRDWRAQLPRIAAMHFDWVFLNPFHSPGFSGSLYAVKDYYRLHPLFQGRSRLSADDLLRDFLREAEQCGLTVMMDLVINHTAKDGELTVSHPDWFAYENGELSSPYAVDPDDPSQITTWGDLAEIDYVTPGHQEAMLSYWQDLIRHYLRLGFRGFRCDAAYKVPGHVWAEIIEAARETDPKACFFAETLGCQPDEVAQLDAAGFDYIFNSSKWWDFRAPWLLEQHEIYRRIAPSIAFPESHDTARLAAESEGDERISRLRYLFAAFFSTGVMMTMGYEFGFRRALNVVTTRPEDWEEDSFDISPFIQAVNTFKAECPVLNTEGSLRLITDPDSPIVGLLREGEHAHDCALGLINTDASASHEFIIGDTVSKLFTAAAQRRDISSLGVGQSSEESGGIHLQALEMRVFV